MYTLRSSGWVRARRRTSKRYKDSKRVEAPAGFKSLRVHDLRHTFDQRLRAINVSLEGREGLVGRKNDRVATDYSAPEIRNLIQTANQVVKCRNSPQLTVLRVIQSHVSPGRLATTAYQRKAAMGSAKRLDSNRTKSGRGARRARHGALVRDRATLRRSSPTSTKSWEDSRTRFRSLRQPQMRLPGAEEREGSTAGADVGDETTTLLHGVRCIKRAYDALDVAVREVRS